jgi:carbon starvation protein
MIQDLLGMASKTLGDTKSLVGNYAATGLACAAWGYFTYQGVIDPFGGINSLWALFGVANQMLAAIALVLATVLVVQLGQMKRIWVTAVPLSWLLLCTLWAGWDKLFHADPRIGFLSHAKMIEAGLAEGKVIPPTRSIEEMERVLFNDYLDAGICAFFMLIVIALVFFGIRAIRGGQGVAVRADHTPLRQPAE